MKSAKKNTEKTLPTKSAKVTTKRVNAAKKSVAPKKSANKKLVMDEHSAGLFFISILLMLSSINLLGNRPNKRVNKKSKLIGSTKKSITQKINQHK